MGKRTRTTIATSERAREVRRKGVEKQAMEKLFKRTEPVIQELERKLRAIVGVPRIEPAVKVLLSPQRAQQRLAREMWSLFEVPGSFRLYAAWLMFKRPALFVRLLLDKVIPNVPRLTREEAQEAYVPPAASSTRRP